jgi:putative pyruvate formate lyase activating enzyme
MYRQVGGVRINQDGLIEKGLIIRHLVLPNSSHDSIKVLEWIHDNIPNDAYISLMAQYTPPEAAKIRGLDRKITKREYDMVVDRLHELELENGFVQDLDSADKKYTPEFDLHGL